MTGGHRPVAHRPRRATARGRWLGQLVRVTCAVLSFAVLVGSGYAWLSYRTFTSGVTHVDAIPHAAARSSSAVAVTGAPGGDAENILLVGDDHRPAGASDALLKLLNTQDDGGGTNTDTMMILHLPAGGGRATVISLPRDSWVTIPGFGLGKLNAAFEDGAQHGGDAGGAQLLITTVQNLTGLTIDHFMRVSLVGFYDIAQVLGPIQVCLKQATQDSYSGTDLPAGVSTLDAQQALSFVRQRHGLPRGDLDREVRQQYFLSTELRRVESAGLLLNPIKLQHLLGAVSSALETDPGLDLLQLADRFQDLSSGDVTFTTIPVTGTPTIDDGDGNQVSIVAVDTVAMPAFIARILGPSTAYSAAMAAAPGATTVQVVNGTGTAGLATDDSQVLARLGFHTRSPGSTDDTTLTTVTYPPGDEAAAKAVAAVVPGALVAASTAVQTVTLTLGTDDLTVGAAAPPNAGAVAGATSGVPTVTGAATPSAGAAPTAFAATACID